MRYLAKGGFSQSYSYFTWRNTTAELTEYFTELTQTPVREYLRPNLFANTPDILHEYLQHGGRPAFIARFVLAATLGALYGIYSGFELVENVPVQAGQRGVPRLGEVSDPDPRLSTQPGSLAELIARVNADPAKPIRRCSATGACASTPPTTPSCSATASGRRTAPICC